MSARTSSRWLGRRSLFALGRLKIPTYPLMLYLGCVAGLLAGAAAARTVGLPEQAFVFTTIILLVPALVGARLWYVIQHLSRYRAEPRNLWRRSEGGMALYGGLLLSVAVSIPILALAGLSFWPFWDSTCITMLVGAVITRAGCLMNGCCAGRATSGPLGLWLPNHRGEWQRRYPTPILEAGWAILLLVSVLAVDTARLFPGARFAGVVGAYAAGRLVLDLTRESARAERRLPIELALSGALLIGAVAVIGLGSLR